MLGAVTALLAALLLAAPARPSPQAGSAAILGWWHGTSTCVRAPWNSACHDETILYEFVPEPPDSNHALLHAAKMVKGAAVPMGDLSLTYSPEGATWDGDFANARVNIRWTYEVRGDTLIGQVVLRPDMKVGRHVVALRGKGSVP